MRVESEPGRTRFTIRLPVQGPSEAALAEGAVSAPGAGTTSQPMTEATPPEGTPS
jgi:hypothetical protein